MQDYKILHGDKQKVQTTLNQWKHNYFLHFLGMTTDIGPSGNLYVTVLLVREEKIIDNDKHQDPTDDLPF